MRKFVKREISTCTYFEYQCNEFYRLLQEYHRACKMHNELLVELVLVELVRFQDDLICFKVDNLISVEAQELLYNKFLRLVRKIESRVLNEIVRTKVALR